MRIRTVDTVLALAITMEGNAKPFWYFLFVSFSTSFSAALLVTLAGPLPREQVVPGVLAIHLVTNDSTSLQLLVLVYEGNQFLKRLSDVSKRL